MRYPKLAALVAALALAGFAVPAPAAAAPLGIAFAGHLGSGGLDLFTVRPNGEGRQQVTSGPGEDTLPAWSPARDQIVFTRDATSGHVRRLFVVRPNGLSLHAIPHTLDGGAPSWSPDGGLIAFDSSHGDQPSRIYTIGPAGTGRTALTGGPGDASPDWSPDSSRIVFERHGQLWTVRADGTHLRKLTDNGRQPAWAPDGAHIAFVRRIGGGSLAVFVMNADGSQVKQLTQRGQRPAWEPNGRHIVFATGAGVASKIRTILVTGTKGITTFVTSGQTPAW